MSYKSGKQNKAGARLDYLLWQYCEEHNVHMKDMPAKLDISHGGLRAYRNEGSAPTVHIALRIAKFLNVDVEDIWKTDPSL